MAFRGFTRQNQKNGAWFKRVALGSADAPNFPPLHISPSAAPTATAAEGDIYLDTNGVLQVHNGTNFVAGGGGDVVLTIPLIAAANHSTQHLLIANRAYQLVSFEEAHNVASSSGTLKLVKATGTQAFGSGVDMVASTISTAGAANTVVSATLSATAADTRLADGDRMFLVAGGTPTNYVSGAITIVLRPI